MRVGNTESSTSPFLLQRFIVFGTITGENSDRESGSELIRRIRGRIDIVEANLLYPAFESRHAYNPPISPRPISPIHGCSSTGSFGDTFLRGGEGLKDICGGVEPDSEKPRWRAGGLWQSNPSAQTLIYGRETSPTSGFKFEDTILRVSGVEH